MWRGIMTQDQGEREAKRLARKIELAMGSEVQVDLVEVRAV